MIAEPKASVIIAGARTGGTFLSHCLSNHPDIHCERGEILHDRNIWRATIPIEPVTLLHCALHQVHYPVLMAKLTYRQAFDAAIWAYLVKIQPHVIWLRRENLLRQTVSVFLLKLSNKGEIDRPVHTTADLPPLRVRLDPEMILHAVRSLREREAGIRKQVRQFARILEVTYAEVVGGEGKGTAQLPEGVGRRICSFLDVPYWPMPCSLKRVNPYPLRDLLANWREFEAAVRGSEFARFLETEWE